MDDVNHGVVYLENRFLIPLTALQYFVDWCGDKANYVSYSIAFVRAEWCTVGMDYACYLPRLVSVVNAWRITGSMRVNKLRAKIFGNHLAGSTTAIYIERIRTQQGRRGRSYTLFIRVVSPRTKCILKGLKKY